MDNLYFAVAAVLLIAAAAVGSFVYLVRRMERSATFRDMILGRKWLTECIVCLAALLIGWVIFLKGFTGLEKVFIRALIDGMTAIWLIMAGYIDLREKIIPNALIGAGLIFWVVIALLDVFVAGNHWVSTLMFSLAGGLVLGGILFVLALILKNALGMGDAKMFLVLGLLYGLNDTYTVMLLSMVIMAVVSLVLLALKKVTPKTAIPMAPFVAVGFLLSIFAGM